LFGLFFNFNRILDVNSCSKLTDTGIEWLVLKPTELGKTLQELLVTCAAVTKRGIKMALQNFPALQVVENDNIFDALLEEVVQSSSLAQPHISNTSFARLTILPAGEYRNGQLELVMQYCPSLFDIAIIVKEGLIDTDLLSLTSVKNLQILKFMLHPSSTGQEITFDKGLAPVLKVIGRSLKVLDISYFEFVDIWTVVRFCPNLMSLTFDNQCPSLSALSENEIINRERNEKGRVILEDLKVLRCGFNLSNDILFDLLSCPLLEMVDISFCDALTDDLLQEVLAIGFLKNLNLLHLESCHLVTKQGLDALVLNDNLLERISLFFCRKITHQNVLDWHSIARQKNWKLRLDYENLDSKPISLILA
jgi:hypothetical protein